MNRPNRFDLLYVALFTAIALALIWVLCTVTAPEPDDGPVLVPATAGPPVTWKMP